MFARGRPCLRSCTFSTFLDGVAVVPTEEPLHFLYPRWLISASHKISGIRCSSSQALISSYDFDNCHCSCFQRSHRPTVHATSRRWLLSPRPMSGCGNSQAPLLLKPSSLRSIQHGGQTNLSGDNDQQDTTDTRGADHSSSPEYTPTLDLDKGSLSTASASQSTDDSVSSADSSSNPIRIRRLLSKSPQSGSDQASASKPSREIGLFGRQLDTREAKKLRYRRHVIQTPRKTKGVPTPPHWIDIMAFLESMNVDTRVWPTSTRHKVLHVPEETVMILSGSNEMKENIWYMSIRNGCRVRVLDAEECDALHRKVILSGTQQAIDLIEDDIRRIQDSQADGKLDMKKPPVPIIPSLLAMQRSGVPTPLVRGVWAERTRQSHAPPNYSIPNTDHLTVNKFAEYVQDLLVSGSTFRGEARSKHRNRVRDILEQIFQEDTNQKFFSTSALNSALSFLCDNEFLDSARVVLSRAEAVTSTDSFNILLQMTSKRQDHWFFRRVLSYMSRLHVLPNGRTWIAFLSSLISPGAKTKVMQRMEGLGYLDNRRTLEAAVQNNLGIMLARHLESSHDLPSFIQGVEGTFGPGIVSRLELNLILEAAVTRNDFALTEQVAEAFKQRKISVDSRTLDQILRLFRDYKKAVPFLFHHFNLPMYPFNEGHFEQLFLLAWKSLCYNSCRVIWRYACMECKATPLMRKIVRDSVLRQKPDYDYIAESEQRPSRAARDAWQWGAGRVVIGLDLLQADVEPSDFTKFEIPSFYADNPILFLTQSEPLDKKQQDFAVTLAMRDVDIGRTLKPVEPLEVMLQAALVLDTDESWKYVSGTFHIVEILKNAILIPVRREIWYPKDRPQYTMIPS